METYRRTFFIALVWLLSSFSQLSVASEPPQTLLVCNPDSGRQHGLEFGRGYTASLCDAEKLHKSVRCF